MNIKKFIYSILLYTHQNLDENFNQNELLTIEKVTSIIVIINYTDKLKLNQMKYKINQ